MVLTINALICKDYAASIVCMLQLVKWLWHKKFKYVQESLYQSQTAHEKSHT
jgi:hypothetical protein